MAALNPIETGRTDALAREAFAGLGCVEGGVALLAGARSWQAHETGVIQLPGPNGAQVIAVAYDEREAPFAVRDDGREDVRTLLSLSDEGERLACAWAHVEDGSPVLGVGVDLASRDDFGVRPGTERFVDLLFTERERGLARELCPTDEALAFATLFAAKEAAFKACARPLRAWYEGHVEELAFDLRHFCMVELGRERGTARDGAAQRAMDALGIAEMRIFWCEVPDAALVVAVALAHDERDGAEGGT